MLTTYNDDSLKRHGINKQDIQEVLAAYLYGITQVVDEGLSKNGNFTRMFVGYTFTGVCWKSA